MKILDSRPLEEMLGEIQFDSERSKQEQDFRNISKQVSDEELARRALNNNAGRANSVLALPLGKVRQIFLKAPAEKRFNKMEVDHHLLDESVLAVLENIEVLEYLRL